MDREFWISELTDDALPAVVQLCRAGLDLPEDAAEAAEIVHRLRDTTGTDGWATGPRRTSGFVASAPEAASAPGETAVCGNKAAGERIIGVALGSISHEDASVGHVDLIAVHPAERRRGVGRRLVGRLEGALAALGARQVVAAGNAPYYAWPGIDVRYTPAVCAAMALGFAQERPAWNMTADLRALTPADAGEKRLAGAGVTIRRAEPADLPLLTGFALTNWSPGWAGEITHSIGRAGAGCWLAVEADGTLLGFAAYGSSRPTWFGPMGTTPAARGRGIGSVLLRRCLAEQRAAGHDTAQIGWVGPLPFYSTAVGARVERVFFRFRKRL